MKRSTSLLGARGAILAVVLVAAIALFAVFFDFVAVSGVSMENTLHSGDLVLMARMNVISSIPWLRRQLLRKGSIVILRDPLVARRLIVKRIAGFPGDRIRIAPQGVVLVNDNRQAEPQTVKQFALPWPSSYDTPPRSVTVMSGTYFLLSDNRVTGLDSRIFGTITEDEIVGIFLGVLRHRSS
jgi:signal peptidase I